MTLRKEINVNLIVPSEMPKITPRTDPLGDLTIDYHPNKHPVQEVCHLHLRWAKEKCPVCGSALMIYYTPTFIHRSGQFSLH
jgi:hypothetical protein